MSRHLFNPLPAGEARSYGAGLEARERCARCGLLLLWRHRHTAVFATVRTPGRARSPLLVRYSAPPGCVVVPCERCEPGGLHGKDCALRHPELAVLVPLLSRAHQDDMMALRWSRKRTSEELILEGLLEAGRDPSARLRDEPRVAGRYAEARPRLRVATLWVRGWEPDVVWAVTRARLLQALHAREQAASGRRR